MVCGNRSVKRGSSHLNGSGHRELERSTSSKQYANAISVFHTDWSSRFTISHFLYKRTMAYRSHLCHGHRIIFLGSITIVSDDGLTINNSKKHFVASGCASRIWVRHRFYLFPSGLIIPNSTSFCVTANLESLDALITCWNKA